MNEIQRQAKSALSKLRFLTDTDPNSREYGCVIYYDKKDGKIHTSNVTKGEPTVVDGRTTESWRPSSIELNDSQVALAYCHSHPDNGNSSDCFSPEDLLHSMERDYLGYLASPVNDNFWQFSPKDGVSLISDTSGHNKDNMFLGAFGFHGGDWEQNDSFKKAQRKGNLRCTKCGKSFSGAFVK